MRTTPVSKPESAYRTLARELRTSLLKGRFKDGARLPTEAELARRYAVSRQTVRRAFHDLVTEGLVYRVPGRGTFAAQPDGRYLRQFGSIEDLMSLSADTNMELLSTLQRRVDLEAAGRLRLDTDIVYTMVFRRLHDVTPFCVTTVHLPPHIAEYLSDVTELAKPGNTSPATIIGLLDERMPLPIAEAEQSITVAQAHPLAVTVLSCKPGDCLLRIDRLYMTLDGEPVEIAVSFYLPEHYSYRVHLRRSVP